MAEKGMSRKKHADAPWGNEGLLHALPTLLLRAKIYIKVYAFFMALIFSVHCCYCCSLHNIVLINFLTL